jgi:hypothetical protein
METAIGSRAVNQMRTRLQALGLLDRAIAATSDEEVEALVAGLGDDHREAVERLAGGTSPADIRDAVHKGRINGTMEDLATVLSDACLADCVKELGDHADNPTTDQLREVLPGVVERHGVGVTRIMLASTVAGDAPAAPVIRDLLKHDDLVKLPPAEPRPMAPIVQAPTVSDPERAAIREKRRLMKEQRQAEARARRAQSARDRGRA